MLNVTFYYCYAECNYAECYDSEPRGAEFSTTEILDTNSFNGTARLAYFKLEPIEGSTEKVNKQNS